MENNNFKENELIVYQNGDRFEIGRIKRLVDDGAFVYYHSGDTASKTPFDCMHKLTNAYCIPFTILGGASGWIPCSERLPTDGEVHECTAQFSTGMLYIEYSYYDIAREEWWAHDDTGLVNVIAWREHPAPYQPKGEK